VVWSLLHLMGIQLVTELLQVVLFRH
jgi:hypothetical protein